MRGLSSAIVAAALTLPILATAAAPSGLPQTLNTQLPYPAEVSIVQERMGWTLLQSSSNLPLYVYAPASPSGSCNGVCERQWVPLLAPTGEKPLGQWTILVRRDGRRQWAFDQYPVYTYRHDKPDMPSADGAGGVWHLMHFRS
jgi:predicted lipoprotein with Yx(FWY)xxD motif